jgi:anaphase-promoting complex subunit 6
MSAYRSANRLFPGSHIPTLYIGMQYIRTNALNLAHSNLKLSQEICSTDPLLYNELGVICYKSMDYQTAIQYFQHSINISPKDEDLILSSWEPAYFNLGHCFKKIGFEIELLTRKGI